ncbi:hypothetical protein CUR178_01029 [Leishmania enriettii]|uniref:Uncharacterized protein n=1 Tax=Leishmania enriettii TaxID=5663 RepID=A0A836G3R1_LEIEN|nr:hypothetical protein CUR178_01029 [Leishmania enriettii]
MRSSATQLPDMSESSTPAASLVGTAVTQARAPAGGDDDEETVLLVPFSLSLAAASATTPVEPRMEGNGARPFAEALVLVNGSASTSCAVDDTTESSVRAGVPFLAEKKGTEVILGDAPQDFLPSPPPSAATCQPRCATQDNVDSSSREDGEGDRKVDGADDAEVARGNAIQDKYNITSEGVERLPKCDLTALADDPKCATGCAERTSVAAAERDDKRRRGGDGVKDGPGKGAAGERKRRAQEKAEAAELQMAFKQSQRALRKQAKLVNMRDVFSRTLSLPSPLQTATDTVESSFSWSTSPADTGINSSGSNGDTSVPAATGVSSPASLRFGSHAISPTSLVSPPNSTAWSPGLVGELTNRFLARVQQQKRQKFEQMVSRELSQSQALSQTRSLTLHPRQLGGAEDDRGDDNVERDPRWRTDSAMASGFAAPVDELVIGEENDEAANWMPADPFSLTSQHARRTTQRESVSGDEVVLLGASSSQEGRFPSFSTTPAENRKAEEEEEAKASQEQKEVVRSLARKHEIWKLKQRQMRAQEQVELDERAKMIQHQKSSETVATATSSPSSSVRVGLARGDAESAPATSSLATTAASAPFFTDFFRPFQAATAGISYRGHSSSDRAPITARSIQSAKLSAEDISMIRRINNFDNTSTQRVVVFGTAASKQEKDERAQR